MRILLWAVVIALTFYSNNTVAQTCSTIPDCSSLGYTKTASQCSGRTYTVCPFDTSKYSCDTTTCADLGYIDTISECPGEYDICQYDKTKGKCIYEARPGDLKYSWQTKNHNGWLLCDGKSFSKTQFPELYAAINRVILPNYADYYLRGAATTDISTFKNLYPQTLPNITGTLGQLRGDTTTYYNSSGAFMTESSGYAWNGNSNVTGRKVTFDASKSNSTYGEHDPLADGVTTNVNPKHYIANIFMFAGKNKMPDATDTDITGKYVYSDGSTSTSYDSSKTLLGYGVSSNIYVWGGKDVAQGTSINAAFGYAALQCSAKGGFPTTSYMNQYLYGKSIASNTVVGNIYTTGSTFFYVTTPANNVAFRPTSTSSSTTVTYSSSHNYLYYCYSYYTPMNSNYTPMNSNRYDWRCKTCGYIHNGSSAPSMCPTCKGTSFEQMNSNIYDWRCKACGYIHNGSSAPSMCPTCKGTSFEQMNSNIYDWRCKTCGYIHNGSSAPSMCPTCKGTSFEQKT